MNTELNMGGFTEYELTVNIYNFHPETREYISTTIETLPIGTGIPAFSCIDEPPVNVGSDEVIIRNDENTEWIILKDYRGKTIYDKSDSYKTITITDIGDFDTEKYTLIEPNNIYSIYDEVEKRWVISEFLKSEYIRGINEKTRDEILHKLNTENDLLWKELQLGTISDNEKEYLVECMNYMKMINNADLSDENFIFPELPVLKKE